MRTSCAWVPKDKFDSIVGILVILLIATIYNTISETFGASKIVMALTASCVGYSNYY